MSGGSTIDDGDFHAPDSDLTEDAEFGALLRKAASLGVEHLSPPLPLPGAVIDGKYRIDVRLGRGGMGAVYRATHVVSHKPVALKWMLRSAADESARRRLLREARVAGRIDHPNVVDVYDIGREGPCCYLVMELLYGEPLRKRLERGRLGVYEAVDLLIPAMRGVAAVHRAGVIHRDLKPDNIFLCQSPDGVAREAKVLDFGISAIATADGSDGTLTEEGALLGTPSYMSPEQLQSVRDIDAASDIYSFGVILYEALTGKLPFEADSYPGLVLAIVQEPPKALREHCPEVPVELESVVLRALAKRREDRYRDIDGLIAAVLPFASERVRTLAEARGVTEPTAARPAGARVRQIKLALGVLAFGGAVALSTWLWSYAQEAPTRGALPSAAKPMRQRARVETVVHPFAASPVSKAASIVESVVGAPAGRAAPMTATVSHAATSGQTPSDPAAAPTATDAAAADTRRAGVAGKSQDVAGSRKPGGDRPAPRRVRRDAKLVPAGCDPPFSIDAAGHTQFKLKCL